MAKGHLLSKLAVILHADVVGSTALVQHDETVAHERIQDSFCRFSKIIEAYGGVTHELRGDALVAVFDRASDAVSAGIAFQADNSQVNATLEDGVCPVVREINLKIRIEVTTGRGSDLDWL